MNKQVSDAMRLFLITIVAGFLLGVVYFITKTPITQQEINTQQSAYKSVLKDADSFEPVKGDEYTEAKIQSTYKPVLTSDPENYSNDDILGVVLGKNGDKTVGVVVTVVAHDGYAGDIKYSVGITNEGKVEGVSLLSISETAGLGMKAKTDPSFLAQFANAKADAFKVVKDGSGSASEEKIDAIGGSTITSRAITRGVNSALLVAKDLQSKGILGGGAS